MMQSFAVSSPFPLFILFLSLCSFFFFKDLHSSCFTSERLRDLLLKYCMQTDCFGVSATTAGVATVTYLSGQQGVVYRREDNSHKLNKTVTALVMELRVGDLR